MISSTKVSIRPGKGRVLSGCSMDFLFYLKLIQSSENNFGVNTHLIYNYYKGINIGTLTLMIDKSLF